MPCGQVRPDSSTREVAVPREPGRSSTICPFPGTLTSRSPSGVHASIRAPSTRAHTRAVHPAGTVSVLGTDIAPPPSPGGTTRRTVDHDWTSVGDDMVAGDEPAD